MLGRLRGVSVKMLMHHSRNSEQKQWDETLVLALSGMGRLLRAHLPLLVPMQAFPQVWPHSASLTLLSCLLLHPACLFASAVCLAPPNPPSYHSSFPDQVRLQSQTLLLLSSFLPCHSCSFIVQSTIPPGIYASLPSDVAMVQSPDPAAQSCFYEILAHDYSTWKY